MKFKRALRYQTVIINKSAIVTNFTEALLIAFRKLRDNKYQRGPQDSSHEVKITYEVIRLVFSFINYGPWLEAV